MEFYLIIALIIMTTVALFAIQNAQVITISFLLWSFDGPLVVLLLSCFAGGILTALLLALPGRVKKRRMCEERIRELEREVSEAKSRPEEPQSPPER